MTSVFNYRSYPMNPFLLFLLVAVAACATARAQTGTNVLDWKANTTLTSYLNQQLHAQYAGRPAGLARAAQSAAGAAAYRDSVRARCRRVLGPLPARTPLRMQEVGRLARPGFRIEKVIYESTPNHHVTANVYVPDGPGRWPTVLFPCGHENEAKATISYQQTAMLFATHGFVVLVPDPVSQGERLQLTDAAGKGLTRGGTTEHTLLNAQAALVGHNLPAAELWDNIRGLDYLATRPDVDTARFGCLGNSGGATQTAYLLALEPRLKVAALCSYVAAGERNLELTGPADGCVMLPNAGRLRLDIADWPIAFAPRPLLLLAGRYDFVDFNSIEIAHAEIGGWPRYLEAQAGRGRALLSAVAERGGGPCPCARGRATPCHRPRAAMHGYRAGKHRFCRRGKPVGFLPGRGAAADCQPAGARAAPLWPAVFEVDRGGNDAPSVRHQRHDSMATV
jgi:dienelactone hydrolase